MGRLERSRRFGWVRWKGIEGSVGNAGKVTKVQLVSLERSRRLGWVRWKGLEGSVGYAGKVSKVWLGML